MVIWERKSFTALATECPGLKVASATMRHALLPTLERKAFTIFLPLFETALTLRCKTGSRTGCATKKKPLFLPAAAVAFVTHLSQVPLQL